MPIGDCCCCASIYEIMNVIHTYIVHLMIVKWNRQYISLITDNIVYKNRKFSPNKCREKSQMMDELNCK